MATGETSSADLQLTLGARHLCYLGLEGLEYGAREVEGIDGRLGDAVLVFLGPALEPRGSHIVAHGKLVRRVLNLSARTLEGIEEAGCVLLRRRRLGRSSR